VALAGREPGPTKRRPPEPKAGTSVDGMAVGTKWLSPPHRVLVKDSGTPKGLGEEGSPRPKHKGPTVPPHLPLTEKKEKSGCPGLRD